MSKGLEQFRSHFHSSKGRELRGGHGNKVHSVDWSCDGARLASGSTDNTIRIWNTEKIIGTLTTSANNASTSASKGSNNQSPVIFASSSSFEIRGHTSSVDQIAWSPVDPDLLASASADRTVRLWRVFPSSATCVFKVSGGSSENINLAWSPDGERLDVGSKDDIVTIIAVKGSQAGDVQHRIPYQMEINELAWILLQGGQQLLLLTSGTGAVLVLDATAKKDDKEDDSPPVLLKTLQAHTANCYCIKADPKGRHFAVGAADALVSLWDQRDLTCLRTFPNMEWPIRSLAFSHDGEFIAAASEDPFVEINHVETGETIHRIPTAAAVNTVAWHPSRYLLAYAGEEIDPRTGRPEGNLRIFGISS